MIIMKQSHLTLFAVGLIYNAVAANPPPITTCIMDMTLVSRAEHLVNDTSIRRVYVLCPNTVFTPGVADATGAITGGQEPLCCKSNCVIRCGKKGVSSNNCVIDGTGGFGIFQVPSFIYEDRPKVTENVYYQGITVDGFVTEGQMPVVVGSFFGDVTFQDCVFSNNVADPFFILTEFIQRPALTTRSASIDPSPETPQQPPGYIWKGPAKRVDLGRNLVEKDVDSVDRPIVQGRKLSTGRKLRASDITQDEGTKVGFEGDRILQTTPGFKVSFQMCRFEVGLVSGHLHCYVSSVSPFCTE